MHGSQMNTQGVVSEFFPLKAQLVCKALLPLSNSRERGSVIHFLLAHKGRPGEDASG